MIVYGSSLSPFVRKVLVFAAEKGIAVENQPVRPGDPEFRDISPFGKIPGFRDGDFTISDSTAIVTYLEAAHPEPPLYPAEPRARARAVWYEEFADTILTAAGAKIFFNRVVAPRFLGREGDLEAADRAEREDLPPVLDYLEGIAPEPGRFLVGDRLSIADISVASPFANFRYLDIAIDPARWPRARAWTDAMLARPSFAALIAAEEKMLGR